MTAKSNMEKLIKQTKGLSVHGGTLRLSFTHNGARMREPLKGLEVNRRNILYAADKLARIRQEQTLGTFDYAEHFPDSPRAQLFSNKPVVNVKELLVSFRLEMYLAVKASRLAPSSYKTLTSKARRFRQRFGHRRIDKVLGSEMETWRTELINEGLEGKTINDCMTPARGVFKAALIDGLIDRDPMASIVNFVPDDEANHADPLTREEISRMEAQPTKRASEKAMVCFNVYVGLSVSELIAMSWDDIDMVNWTATIRRARVIGKFKTPKERIRHRTVDILPPAQYWLEQQFERTGHLAPVEIEVLQRNNIKTRTEEFRPVWVSTNTRTYFPNAYNVSDRFFKAFLRKAGIRPRGANQLRHTFASQAWTRFADIPWLLNQLGHRDTTMLERHYGKRIEEDRPDRKAMIAAQMGWETENRERPRPKLVVVDNTNQWDDEDVDTDT